MVTVAVAFSILLAGGDSLADCFVATPVFARQNNVIGSMLSMAPTRPPPRRTLKKRRSNRRRRVDDKSESDDPMKHTFEVKPIRRRDAVEQGLDYWIDEEEINKNTASKLRPAKTGERSNREQMSQEKLRAEIVAPYKQNWIGYLSLTIVILATIVKQFPELLAIPIIPIPDL